MGCCCCRRRCNRHVSRRPIFLSRLRARMLCEKTVVNVVVVNDRLESLLAVMLENMFTGWLHWQVNQYCRVIRL